ncbi:MAG: hypothetical protein IPH00_07550 [Flavobacteriales bacterium]|nr:hypothetical protein [Flavobacteriales bacterium]
MMEPYFRPERVSSTTALKPWSVQSADLDGDGPADVGAGGSGGGTTTLFHNLAAMGNSLKELT